MGYSTLPCSLAPGRDAAFPKHLGAAQSIPGKSLSLSLTGTTSAAPLKGIWGAREEQLKSQGCERDSPALGTEEGNVKGFPAVAHLA